MSHDPKKQLVRIVTVIVVILLISYVLFQAKNLILGPRISIDTPTDGMTLQSEVVEIRGFAKNISAISLNDGPIFVDSEGAFSEKLIAPPGYSIIKLSVEDRFGRRKTEYIHLVLPSAAEISPVVQTIQTMGTTTEISTASSSKPLQATSTNNL